VTDQILSSISKTDLLMNLVPKEHNSNSDRKSNLISRIQKGNLFLFPFFMSQESILRIPCQVISLEIHPLLI